MSRLFVLAVIAIGCTTDEVPAQKPDTKGTEVPIVFDVRNEHFPDSWNGITFSRMVPSAQMRTRSAIKEAMSLYPQTILQNNLEAVYGLGSFSHGSVSMGATNSYDAIYIVNDGNASTYTDEVLRLSFHHEFSSILWRRHEFDEVAWKAVNASGFVYLYEPGKHGDKYDSRTGFDPSLYDTGILCPYAKTCYEEDINMFAEGLFSGNPEFWRAVDGHFRIRRKCTILVDFYSKLDPQFSESFFRSLVKK